MTDLRAILNQVLPEVDLRLRKPEIDGLVARVAGADLAAALRGLVEGVDAAIADWEQDALAVAQAPDERAAVVAWLQRRAPRETLAGDLRATRRGLDKAVVRERTARAVDAIGVEEELALRALGALPDAPVGLLVARLRAARRWQTRRAAAQALTGLALDDDAVAAVRAVCGDAGESVWVRDAADGALIAARPGEAAAHLGAGLAVGVGARDFLLRRRRVTRALRSLGAEAALPVLGAVVRDPSEHVRLGLALDLAADVGPAGFGLLARLVQGDPSARVRSAVFLFASRHPLAGAEDRVAALAAHALARDPDAAVRVSAAWTLASLVPARPDLTPMVKDALTAVIADRQAGPVLHEACAAARARAEVAGDGARAALAQRLADAVAQVPEGGRVRLLWGEVSPSGRPDDADLGAVLADLAARDFGLWAWSDADGVTLRRGDRERVRAWRVLHELRHPAPAKRNDRSHMVGRDVAAPLRAPPGRMAEVTATTVPGERVIVDRTGGWGAALPTVDDLLDLPAGGVARLFTAAGETTITAPSSWFGAAIARLRLTWSYAAWASDRQRALGAEEDAERAAWLRDVHARLGYRVALPEGAPPHVSSLSPTLALAPALVEPLRRWLGGVGTYLASPSATSQAALAVFAAGGTALMLVEGFVRRRQIRRDRDAIPLSIGGWGTRGKSGTERLKAGLFHGLGHATFVKTTGCEAMFIPAWPGLMAREIFVHRPYDKATIWEQARLLRLAARMNTRVFLWECMALRPRYVEVLEQRWMRDDLCTITNAFPDHEDIQGPAGVDVARAIASFIPVGSVAVTSEHEFLPIFRDRARERGTALHAVDPSEADLLGEDLLALFPYQEHPRNIALVARTAALLGLEPDLAVSLMADHVVPDLGVLRTYPPARVEGRSIVFSNGMSANERTGTVHNWRRVGLDRVGLAPDVAVVTVVNNRADRVARSEVFARILVQDLEADRHVLIGTNLRGLQGYVDQALAAELRAVSLVRPEDTSIHAAVRRLEGWMARLRIPAPSVDALTARVAAWAAGSGASLGDPAGALALVARWLDAAPGLEVAYGAVRAQIAGDAAFGPAVRAWWRPGAAAPDELLGPADADAGLNAITDLLARLVVHARLRADAEAGSPALNKRFALAWAELFRASLVVLDDPGASGDAIVVQVARAAPPGVRVRVMGVQNIKGTGLDFAYRWLAHGTVSGLLDRVATSSGAARVGALRDLLGFDDHGLIDAATVAHRLAAASPGEEPAERELREAVVARASAIAARRREALSTLRRRGWLAAILDRVEDLVDWLDGVLRARHAAQLADDVATHRVSLGAAAQQMTALTARQHGGWLARAFGVG